MNDSFEAIMNGSLANGDAGCGGGGVGGDHDFWNIMSPETPTNSSKASSHCGNNVPNANGFYPLSPCDFGDVSYGGGGGGGNGLMDPTGGHHSQTPSPSSSQQYMLNSQLMFYSPASGGGSSTSGQSNASTSPSSMMVAASATNGKRNSSGTLLISPKLECHSSQHSPASSSENMLSPLPANPVKVSKHRNSLLASPVSQATNSNNVIVQPGGVHSGTIILNDSKEHLQESGGFLIKKRKCINLVKSSPKPSTQRIEVKCVSKPMQNGPGHITYCTSAKFINQEDDDEEEEVDEKPKKPIAQPSGHVKHQQQQQQQHLVKQTRTYTIQKTRTVDAQINDEERRLLSKEGKFPT